MTKWVVGFITVAIVAFILNDLFGTSPRSIFGNQETYVGEIAGHDIYLEEYQAAIQERENNYILSFGRQAGERVRASAGSGVGHRLDCRPVGPIGRDLQRVVTSRSSFPVQDDLFNPARGTEIDANPLRIAGGAGPARAHVSVDGSRCGRARILGGRSRRG